VIALPSVHAVTINFDDNTGQGPLTPNQYASLGVTITNGQYFDMVQPPYNAHSVPERIYSADRTSGITFNFDPPVDHVDWWSTGLSSLCGNFTALAWLNGNAVGSLNFTLSPPDGNFTNMIVSGLGSFNLLVVRAGLDQDWVLDDLTFFSSGPSPNSSVQVYFSNSISVGCEFPVTPAQIYNQYTVNSTTPSRFFGSAYTMAIYNPKSQQLLLQCVGAYCNSTGDWLFVSTPLTNVSLTSLSKPTCYTTYISVLTSGPYLNSCYVEYICGVPSCSNSTGSETHGSSKSTAARHELDRAAASDRTTRFETMLAQSAAAANH